MTAVTTQRRRQPARVPEALLRAAWEARKDFHGAVDILHCRLSTFDDGRDVIGSIVHTAASEGVTVYERR